MIKLSLTNKTGRPYAEVRDQICEALVGSPSFINNEIVVSDHTVDAETGSVVYDNQAENVICILIGNDTRPDGSPSPFVELFGSIDP